MITHRLLPPEEWHRVADIPPFSTGGLPNPDYWRIVVVERDGVIVACSSLFDTVHWDCFWAAEAERGNPVVFRELVNAGMEIMALHGIPMVHTTVPTENAHVIPMLQRFGFNEAHGRLFYFSPPQRTESWVQ